MPEYALQNRWRPGKRNLPNYVIPSGTHHFSIQRVKYPRGIHHWRIHMVLTGQAIIRACTCILWMNAVP